MQGKQSKAEQPAAEPKGKPKAEAPKRRRLTKAEYGALSDKHKAQYDAQFPKSGHTVRFKKSKKPKTNLAINGKESRKDAAARRKAEGLEVDAQRNTMHVEGAGVINKESVKALALIRPQHLQQAAANIDNNRDEVHEMVKHAFADKPKLLERGLASVRDMMQGGLLDDDDAIEGEFEEIDEDSQATDADGTPLHDEQGNAVTRKQAKESQTQDRDKPFIGRNGKPATFTDGSPILQSDVDRFNDSGGVVSLPKKFGKAPYADADGNPTFYEDGSIMTMQDKAEDDFADIRKALSVKRSPNRAHKDSKKQRDGMSVTRSIIKYGLLAAGIGLMAVAAGPLTAVIARGLLEYWSDMRSLSSADADKDEQNTNTVDELITQTVSYLRNMDHDDLQSQSKDMFTAIAASPSVDVYNIAFSAVLPWVSERPKGRPGKNFFGGTHSTRKQIAEAIAKALDDAKVLREHEQYRSDGDECDLFYCKDSNRTLIALGSHDLLGIYHVAFLNW